MLTAFILCRFLHFTAVMLLFGASAFVWAIAPGDLAGALMGPVRRMIAAATVVAAITALVWTMLEGGQMGDGWTDTYNPEVVTNVLFDTAFGRVWIWRLALLLILLAALTFRGLNRLPFIVPISALLLASLGLVGHATMQSGLIGALQRLNHCVHLLSAGAWVGGLAPFILCLRRYDDPRLQSDVGAALRRFSGSGHFVVALIVLTGAVNTALTLRAWPIDLMSPYQALLDAKVAIVAAMIATAMFNRYILAPRMKHDTGAALRALTINSAAEAALGMAVIGLVSIFAILEPV